jgi:DNA-binding transcriptional ArsR family regulator
VSELPRREIRDAQTARALAHEVRIKLVEQLAFCGPMTATELSGLIGESPANTSWHLRQLARYGFIEEASGGTGRQRPWQLVIQNNSFVEAGHDPDVDEATRAAVDLWLRREFDALREWQDREATEPDWARAAYLGLSLGWFTLDELREVGEQIRALVAPYAVRIGDLASRPPGARPVRMVHWGIPATTEEEQS